VRSVSRLLIALFVAVASSGAAFAHFAIDWVGDYALKHDTFDDVSHGSREALALLGVAVAVILVCRALRLCCEIGAADRFRRCAPALSWRAALPFVGLTALAVCIAVPAMECFDTWYGHGSIAGLSDAFGGSLLLGLGLAVGCSSLTAVLAFAIARWLIAHRETVASALLVVISKKIVPVRWIRRRFVAPLQRLTVHATRLSKRGPPKVDALFAQHHTRQPNRRSVCLFHFCAPRARYLRLQPHYS
jgi:hypothetical protein